MQHLLYLRSPRCSNRLSYRTVMFYTVLYCIAFCFFSRQKVKCCHLLLLYHLVLFHLSNHVYVYGSSGEPSFLIGQCSWYLHDLQVHIIGVYFCMGAQPHISTVQFISAEGFVLASHYLTLSTLLVLCFVQLTCSAISRYHVSESHIFILYFSFPGASRHVTSSLLSSLFSSSLSLS